MSPSAERLPTATRHGLALLVLLLGAGPAWGQDQDRPDPAGEERVAADTMLPMARDLDDPVVQVGEEVLRASDVFRELDLVIPGTSADVIRQMVLSSIARQEALELGIDVPAAALADEVELAVAEQRARFALEVESETSLEEFMQGRYGFSRERYRAEIATRVMASMLLERVVRYDQRSRAREELQVIVVEELPLAQELRDKLDQGASFNVLARNHSVHPSASGGGLLPVVPTDAEIPLLGGRRGMEPGDLLGPAPITLDDQTLYRILRLVDRMPADDRPWAEVRDEIEAELAERPLTGDELTLFEARMVARYRVTRPSTATEPP